MRYFLTKSFFYFLILFSAIAAVVIYNYETARLPFFSNSICFNAKAKFILENKEYFNESKYLVIGSSMSLNNIDCNILSDSIGEKVFNLSSWGMNFKNFNDFNIWDTANVIITNIHFQDFHQSRIKNKYGYPFSNFRLINHLNISLDFVTYLKQLDFYKSANTNGINDNYDDLSFNKSGSIIFSDKEIFKLSDFRWNKDVDMPNESELKEFINSVIIKSKSVKRLIILFSPGRESIKNKQKVNFVNELKSYLNSVPNVVFFNNFNSVDFSDEDFVDHSHFSGSGAKKYSEIVTHQIKSVDLN